MKLFSKEVINMNELNEVLKDNNEISKECEVAVIVYALIRKIKLFFKGEV